MAIVKLKQVTREDIKRISIWLEDKEINENWFGRYTYGDPAHLGYDPQKMLSISYVRTRFRSLKSTSSGGRCS